MDKDTFYVVAVPQRTKEKVNWGARPGYWECGFFTTKYIPPEPATSLVVVPEERHYFNTSKEAKKFCLDNNYPFSYITEGEM